MTNEDYIKAEVAKRIKNDPRRKMLDLKFGIAISLIIIAGLLNWYVS